jgi:hypothetical protein
MSVLVYDNFLVRDLLYPSFYSLKGGGRVYMKDRVGTIVRDSNSISTCPIYKIWFHIYLLNYLGYGPPGLNL